MWRLRPTVLIAALWAVTALRTVRRQLRAGSVNPTFRGPPRLPDGAELGVLAVLSRLSPTCLEGATVRRRWLAAHGQPRDIVIGVPPGGLGDAPAHAWVDGTDPRSAADYLELYRL